MQHLVVWRHHPENIQPRNQWVICTTSVPRFPALQIKSRWAPTRGLRLCGFLVLEYFCCNEFHPCHPLANFMKTKVDKRTKDEVIKQITHIYIMWNLHIEITRMSFFQIFWDKKLYKLPISPLSATQIATLIASVGPIERYKPQSFGNKDCDEIDPFIQGAAPMKKYLRQSSNSSF